MTVGNKQHRARVAHRPMEASADLTDGRSGLCPLVDFLPLRWCETQHFLKTDCSPHRRPVR
jgi:hypothetical protein